jgi:hypothetical protein
MWLCPDCLTILWLPIYLAPVVDVTMPWLFDILWLPTYLCSSGWCDYALIVWPFSGCLLILLQWLMWLCPDCLTILLLPACLCSGFCFTLPCCRTDLSLAAYLSMLRFLHYLALLSKWHNCWINISLAVYLTLLFLFTWPCFVVELTFPGYLLDYAMVPYVTLLWPFTWSFSTAVVSLTFLSFLLHIPQLSIGLAHLVFYFPLPSFQLDLALVLYLTFF